MHRAIEAITEEGGGGCLLEAVRLPPGRRVLVVVLDDAHAPGDEAALLSEGALAEDWDRPEEDEAWAHLQPER
jgi:hypothetical protein